ncbi:hypothetical protein CDAR_185111 [Caerostris darwini]|uniref:Uncharacterized protein n=1 Tax=Caerostris darwini TaxID=1538125 RepID=A0AAV4ST51_9ARAC|nr:hypothetical protein CDAR_185111 [Caerostris darwini]
MSSIESPFHIYKGPTKLESAKDKPKIKYSHHTSPKIASFKLPSGKTKAPPESPFFLCGPIPNLLNTGPKIIVRQQSCVLLFHGGGEKISTFKIKTHPSPPSNDDLLPANVQGHRVLSTWIWQPTRTPPSSTPSSGSIDDDTAATSSSAVSLLGEGDGRR